VRGFEASSGKEAWKARVAAGVKAAAAAGDLLLVSGRESGLVGIAWGAAEPAFEIAVGSPVVGTAAASPKWIYVAAEDGVVRVYDRKAPKEPVWMFNAGERISQAPLVVGSLMFVSAGPKVFGIKAD
jgi:hypothetical protein